MLLLAFMVLAFVGGVVLGSYGSLRRLQELAQENSDYAATMHEQQMVLSELEQAQTGSKIQAEVDGRALELVRSELAEQQALISELEKGLHFYKSLMAPAELAEGLSISSIDIWPAGHEGHYQFRIMVQQSARRHDLVSGSLKVKLVGTRGGAEEALDLSKVTEDVPASDIRLRFKYFQAIDGDLDIPEGFVPLRFEAVARATKPKKVTVSKTFPWSVQEKLTHVGQ